MKRPFRLHLLLLSLLLRLLHLLQLRARLLVRTLARLRPRLCIRPWLRRAVLGVFGHLLLKVSVRSATRDAHCVSTRH